MTMQEIKDRVDELIQLYPFIKESDAVIQQSKKNPNKEIVAIEVDKYCRPIVIIK